MFRKSFRGKIIIPTIIVLIVLVSVLTGSLIIRFTAFSDFLINRALTSHIYSLNDNLSRNMGMTKVAAVSMASNIDAIAAIEKGDRAAILEVFSNSLEFYQIDFYTITDENGIVLARTHEPDHFGDSVLGQKNISDALNGKVSSIFEEGTVVKVSMRTGAPVYDENNNLIGVVSAGFRLDTESFVDGLKKMYGSDFTVFLGDTRIATTLTSEEGERLTGTTIDPEVVDIVFRDKQEYIGESYLSGQVFKTYYKPLINSDGDVFAIIFIGLSEAELHAQTRDNINQGLFIGIIGLVVSVALLIFIVSRISRPLVSFTKDIENIANGDLQVQIEVKTDDEIGRLGKALTQVVSVLDRLFTDINTMISEIEKGNTDYVFDVEDFNGDYKTLSELILKLTRLNIDLDKLVKERTLELEKQTVAAQSANRAKSIFLATMSHELRTPLNAVIGMANIIQRSPALEKAQLSAGQILKSSHHLLGILNDVLDMSNIESENLTLTYEPFSFLEAYNGINNMIKPRCADKEIKYITNIDEHEDLSLVGDKARLIQTIVTLLDNAVKFTDKGGEVTFTVRITEENEKNVKLYFSVADTGIGMTEEQKSRLFVPFGQIDKDVTSKYGGTGLGLSISQNLVEMMGGLIGVESEPGKGSEFYFSICIDKEKENVSAGTEALDLTGKRFLVVDDVEINRLILMEILADTGVSIDEAEDGQVAFNMFNDSDPGYYSLIFMDIRMPVMNGFEATEKIRASDHPDAKSIPVIAVSANSYQEDVDAALKSGMNEHIAKPVDMDILAKNIRKYII